MLYVEMLVKGVVMRCFLSAILLVLHSAAISQPSSEAEIREYFAALKVEALAYKAWLDCTDRLAAKYVSSTESAAVVADAAMGGCQADESATHVAAIKTILTERVPDIDVAVERRMTNHRTSIRQGLVNAIVADRIKAATPAPPPPRR